MKKESTSILTFLLRSPSTGDDADPRWQRVEALTREIAALEPRFGQHLAQRLEQTFAALIPYLLETLDLDHQAEMMTMTHRAEINRVERYRREALERLAQGRPVRGDTFWAEEAPASDRLDDLLIRLQRSVREYRRGRLDCYEQRSEASHFCYRLRKHRGDCIPRVKRVGVAVSGRALSPQISPQPRSTPRTPVPVSC